MTEAPCALSREFIAACHIRGDGIEVGALQAPLPLPPAARVKYVDRMANERLRAHYPELSGQPLVDVDVVDDGETLASFADASLDFVVANHFLEHCQDPIATFASFLRVLRPGGIVYAAVPDKRHTFTSDRATTTLEHLLRDHRDGPTTSRQTH